MTPQENKKIVQDAYAAFGRGDIPSLLNSLADDVDWEGVIGAGPNVPTHGRRRGRDEVAKFFGTIAATSDFTKFEVRHFIAEGDMVAVTGHYAMVIKSTKRTFASDWVMVFTMRDGKVVHFQEFMDALALTQAF